MHQTFFRCSLFGAIMASTLALSHANAQIIRLDAMGGGGGFSRSVSVTEIDGVKTTNVTENGKKYLLREGDGFVEIQFAKTYGPDDLDKLKQNHPDLYMHVTSFPKTSGESKVELTVSVKEIVKAETLKELKEKNPEAHQLFEKFTKSVGIPAMRLGGRRIDFAPKMIELKALEADAAKRIEEVEKKAEEMRERLLQKSKELRKKAEKRAEEKADPKSKKKKILIDA